MTGLIIKTTDDEVVVRIVLLDKKTYVCGYKHGNGVSVDDALSFAATRVGQAVAHLVRTGEFPNEAD